MAEYIEREKILDAISEQRRFYLHERRGNGYGETISPVEF